MTRLVLVALLAGGCAAGHWSYIGESGPANWGRYAATCADGKRQSPIDLTGAVEKSLAGVELAYTAGPAKLVHNGHTIQVQPQNGGTISFNGQKWTLKQFHFHHPSEHTIDGQRFPMEMHLVNEGEHGALALGVMLVDGTGGVPFESIFNALPRHEGETAEVATVDPTALSVASSMTSWNRDADTTPPCGENITWVVLKAPVTISKAQLDAFAALFPDNSRPVQPRYDRVIETPKKPAQ